MAALALLSGGLDSLVASCRMHREGRLALALTFDYGQRAAAREIQAAAAMCAEWKVPHEVVALPFLSGLSGNALTDSDRALPEPDPATLDLAEEGRERAQRVWVPNRNSLFIHVAACFAQARNWDRIVVGFNREEAATFPDNSAAFLQDTNRALAHAPGQRIKVESPTIDLNKVEIVQLGLDLNAPFQAIWSCYRGGESHCLRCESCQRLKRALVSSGVWERFASAL